MKICDSYLYTGYPSYITDDYRYTECTFKVHSNFEALNGYNCFTVNNAAVCTCYFYIDTYNNLIFNNYKDCPILCLHRYMGDLKVCITFSNYSPAEYDKSVLYAKHRLRLCDYINNCYIDIDSTEYESINTGRYDNIYSGKSVYNPWSRVDCIIAYVSICICNIGGTGRSPVNMSLYSCTNKLCISMGNIAICSFGNICASNS